MVKLSMILVSACALSFALTGPTSATNDEEDVSLPSPPRQKPAHQAAKAPRPRHVPAAAPQLPEASPALDTSAAPNTPTKRPGTSMPPSQQVLYKNAKNPRSF